MAAVDQRLSLAAPVHVLVSACAKAQRRIAASGARLFVFMGGVFPEKDGVGGVTGRILPERRGECKRFLVCNWYSLFACGRPSVPIEFPA